MKPQCGALRLPVRIRAAVACVFGDGSREGRRHDRDGRRVEYVPTGIPSSSFRDWTGPLEHERKLKPEQEPPSDGHDARDLHAAEDLEGGNHRSRPEGCRGDL